MSYRFLPFLRIILGLLALGILAYNFYTANLLKFKAEGDAASFIGLGVSLAKFQKYGTIKTSGESLMETFKNQNISRRNISFAGHSTWRPPVWPFIIAGIFLLFGYNLTFILIVKFLIHLLGVFIFYKTLRLLKLKQIIILIGSFLYAIHPAWQLYSRTFLSEPITMFLITFWVFLLISFLQKKSGFVPQAVVGGILILSHPYYVFLPFSVWFVLFIKKLFHFKRFILSAAICASVVSVWIIRNKIVLKTDQVVLTTSSGAVMAKGWNKEVLNSHSNTKGDLADETLVLEDYKFNQNKEYNEVERMVLYKDASINFIKRNPDFILPIIYKKLKSAFNPLPENPKPGILETGRVIFQSLAFFAIFYILFLSKNYYLQSLAIGLIVSTIAITIITYSGFRFRMPQTGLELLFIMFCLAEITNRKLKFIS